MAPVVNSIPKPDLIVCVVGLGYVGLPLALLASKMKLQIIGVDTSAHVVDALNQGLTLVDNVSTNEILQSLEQGCVFTTELPDGLNPNIFIICVPTPLDLAGAPDLRHIESAARQISSHLNAGQLVILESTSHPGTTEEILRPILESTGLRAGRDFQLAYSPERIDPGNANFALANTPKIVGAIDKESLDRTCSFYEGLGIVTVQARGTREAEMAKLLENTYRHVNIALVNDLVKYAKTNGIDMWDAIRCAASKPFGFEAFFPGPGVGGHCIPIDPVFLATSYREKMNGPFQFVELANEVNLSMPTYVVERIEIQLQNHGIELSRAKICLVGLSYKKNVGDQRESPAPEITEQLSARGAIVVGYDPHISRSEFPKSFFNTAESLFELTNSVDLFVILQDHDVIDFSIIAESGRLIFDTRGFLFGERVERL